MRILVVGDGMWDRYTFGKNTRMSPEDSSVPILDVHSVDYRFGGAFNVACNLKSIYPTAMVTVCSPMSDYTANKLKEKNITTIGSFPVQLYAPSQDEIIKHRVLNIENGKQIIRIDNRKTFDRDCILDFQTRLKNSKLNYDIVVVSDYNKGFVDYRVVDVLREFDGPVFIDSKKPDLDFWKDITNCFIKINWLEYTSAEHSNRVRNLVVTRSDQPVQLRHFNQLERQFDVEPVDNPDIVGAGDVFLAGMVVNYWQTKDISKAIRFAIKASAKSVLKQGTCEVFEDEICE